jgi:hypothetical protein
LNQIIVSAPSQVIGVFRGEKGDRGIDSGGGVSWVQITVSQELLPNRGYFCTGLALQTLTLPQSADIGDVVSVYGEGVGLFRIAQLSGQRIRVGNKATTLGLAGRIDSLEVGDAIELVYRGSGLWTGNLAGNFEVG